RRFQTMADVRVALRELKEESESGKLSMPAAAPAAKPKRVWVFAASAAVLVAAAVYFGLRSRSAAVASIAEPRTIPFTSYTTAQEAPAFSPDASQIAFSWSGDQGATRHIYVKLIGSETPLQLTSGDAQDSYPAWAPGGGKIAFLRQFPNGTFGVYQVSALGGPEHRITEMAPAGFPRLCWSPDGKWLFTSGRNTDGKSRIWRIAADTGDKQPLFAAETRADFSPAISPDGKLLAFSRVLSDLNYGLFVADLNPSLLPKGAPRQLPTPNGQISAPVWTLDGDIVFRFSASGGNRLWRVAGSGKTPARELPIAPEGANTPAIAAADHRLAYSLFVTDSNILKIPISPPRKAREPPP